jgi:glutathione S-transferase
MCPYAARTWTTLLELGLPFDAVEVSFRDEKPQWFLDVNPRGKVPALVNNGDGTVVYESAICDEYLSDLAREMADSGGGGGENSGEAGGGGRSRFWKLMPTGASSRAALRLLNDRVDAELNPALYTFLTCRDPASEPRLVEDLERALGVLQQSIRDNGGGPYLMGDEFTLADIHVLPFFLRMTVSLRHFKQYELPPDKFADLLRWYELCLQRPSVKVGTVKSDDTIIEVYRRFVDQNYAFGGLNRNK